MGVTVYLGLGSNVGDRQDQIEQALRQLGRIPGIEVEQVSKLRETESVGGPPQDPYLNGIARIDCKLPPEGLLQMLKQLEVSAGRDMRAPRYWPRPLDLDILLYGDQRLDLRDLRVPHPRMANRSFVTEPLQELGVDIASLRLPAYPRVVRDPAEFAAACAAWLRAGCTTGLVPTMGALHEGHASLFRLAGADCHRVAASVFVNPLQFGEGEDLASYPRDLERDLAVLAREGVDLVFAPDARDVYPEGFCSQIAVGQAAKNLEGGTRPGHFSGVATVVAKLFALARPSRAYFGEKDSQQLAVIRRMVRDLGFPVELRAGPTVRDTDGLALSSRNRSLSQADRRAAPVLHRALLAVREACRKGLRERESLLAAGHELLDAEPRVRVDYLELRSEPEFVALQKVEAPERTRVLGAVFVGEGARQVRLIDNVMLASEVEG